MCFRGCAVNRFTSPVWRTNTLANLLAGLWPRWYSGTGEVESIPGKEDVAVSRVDSLLWDPRLDPTIRSADWQYLADLPVPPELERALHDVWKRRGPLSPQ